MVILFIVLGIVVVLALWLIGVYNNLVTLKKRVENAWSQIDVQLKRRHDLIPNLVNSVKGYMKFNRIRWRKVMQARARAVSAQGGRQDKGRAGTGRGARKIARDCRELSRSQGQHQRLLYGGIGPENKISYARQFYNDSATKFNTKIEIFPNNIVVGFFGGKFEAFPLFEVGEVERETPNVDLSF